MSIRKMAASEKGRGDTHGFESWVATKKTKRKLKKGQSVVRPSNFKIRSEGAVEGKSGPPREQQLLKGKLVEVVKDKKKMKSAIPNRRHDHEDGTVVITQKEYDVLLSLKKNSVASNSERDTDGLEVMLPTEDKLTLHGGKGISSQGGQMSKTGNSEEHFGNDNWGGSAASGREVEEDNDELAIQKGKQNVHASPSCEATSVDVDVIRTRNQRVETVSIIGRDNNSSDSDFQHTPKVRSGVHMNVEEVLNSGTAYITQRRLRSAPTVDFAEQQRRELMYAEVHGAPAKKRGIHWADGDREEVPEDEEDAIIEEEQHPQSTVDVKRKAVLARNRSVRESSCQRSRTSMTSTKFFPFEEAVDLNDVNDEERGLWQQCTTESEADEDFQEVVPKVRGSSRQIKPEVLTQSEARAQRKRKMAERELAVRKRESVGQKPYYIMVSGNGQPYGDGMTAWRTELNKLCRALDPSVRDVRQQPHIAHKQIQILKKRLTDNFDYSGVISDKYLMPLIGHRISARRNEIMNAIRAGRPRPSGVNLGAWERLEDILKSPNFQKKSEAMKYANACRQNVGRTGPGGEIRVWNSLKTRLSRSPDPAEVQEEMTRDKGYGGRKRKTKTGAAPARLLSSTIGSDDEIEPQEKTNSEEEGGTHSDKALEDGREGKFSSMRDDRDLIKRMQTQIEELKAKVDGNVFEASTDRRKVREHRL